MSNSLTRRFDFWKRAFYSKVRAAMAIVIAVLGAVLIIRDGVIDPSHRDWTLLKFVPNKPWYWWAVGLLCGLLFLALEGAYKEHRAVLAATRKRYKERLREIKIEQASRLTRPSSTGLEEIGKHFELKRLEPNIVYHETRVVEAYEGDHGIIIEGRKEGALSLAAVVLPYHNAPDSQRKIAEIADVSARLDYSFFGDASPFTIPRGAWLSRKHDRVHFGKNDRRELILALYEEGRVYAVSREFDDANPEGITKRRQMPQAKTAVRMILTTESEMKHLSQLTVMLETESVPVFSAQVEKLKTWKSRHLHNFLSEGFGFSSGLHEIWKNVHEQYPTPKVPEGQALLSSFFRQPPEPFDYAGNQASVRAAEREQEEKLLDGMKDWAARAADWIALFIGAEWSEKFRNSTPSFSAGFKREQRPYSRLLLRRHDSAPPAPTLPYWTLSDAVHERIDVLVKIVDQLR